MNIIPLQDVDLDDLAKELLAGKTIVYPTETSYGLGCSALDDSAVKNVFAIKRRQQTKTVLMVVPDVAMAQRYVLWSEDIDRLAETYWPGPLTIVAPVHPDAHFPDGIVRDGTVAFRVTSHPFASELSRAMNLPLVSTSANIAGEKSPYDITEVLAAFTRQEIQPDIVIDAGDLPERAPSTIVHVQEGNITVLRQGELVVEYPER